MVAGGSVTFVQLHPVSIVQVRPITTLGDEGRVSAPPKWDALGYAAKYGLGIKPKATIGR